MPLYRLILAVALAGSVAAVFGCRSTSERTCAGRDLHTLGYRDGSQGLDASRLLAHLEACSDLEAADVDREAYRRGWDEGIGRYCSPENGFELGSSGATYRNVCPEPLARAFHEGYYAGRQLFNVESEIAELENVLARRSEELARVAEALDAAELHLVRADSTATERARWLEEAKSLVREQRDLEADIDALEREIEVQKDDLASLRSSIADAG